MPCKHLAATFYLLAEAFDDDPFLILRWRGRDREALLGRLRELRADGPAEEPPERTPPSAAGTALALAGWPEPGDRTGPLLAAAASAAAAAGGAGRRARPDAAPATDARRRAGRQALVDRLRAAYQRFARTADGS